MKHHGIKFPPQMIPALLNGTKTRHVERMAPQPSVVETVEKNYDGSFIKIYEGPCYQEEVSYSRLSHNNKIHTRIPDPYGGPGGREMWQEVVQPPIQPGDVVFLDEDFQWVAGDQTTPATRWSAIVKSVEAKRRADLTQEEIKKCGDSEGVACKLSEWIWVYEWRKT